MNLDDMEQMTFDPVSARAASLESGGCDVNRVPAVPRPGTGLRVLFITNNWPTPEHPEYGVFNARQASDLVAMGAEVETLFVNGRDHGRTAYLSAIPHVARAARRADVVHCHHGLTFVVARLAAVRQPMVVSLQNALEYEFEDTPRPVRDLLKPLLRRWLRSERIGVVFKDRVPDWMAGHPLARHIANGVDFDLFTPGDRLAARRALGLDPQAIYLLFVSSKNLQRPQKRYDRFCAVLERIRAERPDLDVRALTLVDSPTETVRQTFQAANAHVMTSTFEGSPNSVKEALASGLPVVSTDVGNVREMIDGLPGCRVLSEFSVEAFSAATVEAIELRNGQDALRERLRSLGLAGRAAAERLTALYREVIAAAGPAQDPDRFARR
jgi:glycosyltransferase involved in cell wall biosynthesis